MKKSKKIILIISIAVLLLLVSLPLLLNKETKKLDQTTRNSAPGAFVELPQGYTHYQEAGADTAQTVLLVHGFSVPYYIWDPTFEALAEEGFHVIRFDLFGRGFSDRPRVKYDQDLFTKQIADLLSKLNIQGPVDIIGLSMGGPISTSFTVKYPEKVNKVVLIDPAHEPVNISILKVPLLNKYLIDVFWAPSLISRQLDDFYYPDAFPEWPDKFKPQMQYKGYKRALLSTLKNYMSIDKLPEYAALGKLDKPVFLIWGLNDKTLPFEGNNRIRQQVTCDFLSVDKAGHLPHYEHPDTVNSRIIEFLKR